MLTPRLPLHHGQLAVFGRMFGRASTPCLDVCTRPSSKRHPVVVDVESLVRGREYGCGARTSAGHVRPYSDRPAVATPATGFRLWPPPHTTWERPCSYSLKLAQRHVDVIHSHLVQQRRTARASPRTERRIVPTTLDDTTTMAGKQALLRKDPDDVVIREWSRNGASTVRLLPSCQLPAATVAVCGIEKPATLASLCLIHRPAFPRPQAPR